MQRKWILFVRPVVAAVVVVVVPVLPVVAAAVPAVVVVVYLHFLYGFWVLQELSWDTVAGEFPCD